LSNTSDHVTSLADHFKEVSSNLSVVRSWFDERIEVHPEKAVDTGYQELFLDYVSWARSRGYAKVNRGQFLDEVKHILQVQNCLSLKRRKSGRFFVGISLCK